MQAKSELTIPHSLSCSHLARRLTKCLLALAVSLSYFLEPSLTITAKRVRELFAAARKKAPSIVFIDELDAIGSKRSAKDQVSSFSFKALG